MKIIKIKNCKTCMFGIPHKEYLFAREEIICLKTQNKTGPGPFEWECRKIEDRKSIPPEWCPLEEYDEVEITDENENRLRVLKKTEKMCLLEREAL